MLLTQDGPYSFLYGGCVAETLDTGRMHDG